MKHIYPGMNGYFQDSDICFHMAQGVTEWFDNPDNDVSHKQRPSQPPDLKQINILEQLVRQRSTPLSSKRQVRKYVFEGRCSIPPAGFQKLEESMPRLIKAVLAACVLKETLNVGFSFNWSLVCI